MESAAAHFTEARNQYFRLQNQLLKAHNRINDVVLNQKRIEAELEEVDQLDDDVKIYKQVSRMFSARTVQELKVDLKKEMICLQEELPKLKEVESGLEKRLIETQKECVEAEKKLRVHLDDGTKETVKAM